MLVDKVQTQLECLYGIGLCQRVEDYLIQKKEVFQFTGNNPHEKIPKELFLVRKPEEDTVEIALFLDQKLLANLSTNSPLVSLNEKNLSDFCILIEGVSHFVYFLWKAQQDLPITQLEMELQAEIDKFLMLMFYLRSDNKEEQSPQLLDALFEDFHLFENLSNEAQNRYLTASQLASRYCYKIHQKYKHNLERLVEEARQFYSFTQQQKIEHILN